MEADGDNLLSADCLEGAAKLKKIAKKLTSLADNNERLTGLDICRSQLINNTRSCKISNNVIKSRPKSESQCYVKSGSKEALNITQEEPQKSRKNLNIKNAQAETLRRSNSEVNQAISLLNKRLEYGKQASSSNRVQMLNSKLKKDEEAKKSISSTNFVEPRRVEIIPTASDEIALEILDSCISKFCEIGIKVQEIRKEL